MDKHLYFIPTNRECSSCIENIFDELEEVKNNIAFSNIYVLLLDSSDKKSQKLNKVAFIKKMEHIGIKHYFYLKQNDCDDYISSIVCNHPQEKKLLKLLNGNVFSYGMAANRGFIIAASLGCKFVHRRDSDVFLQNKNIIPLELELNYLGKSKKDVDKLIFENTDSKKSQIIYMVGSGYKGNWAIDYEDLCGDIETLIKLFHLSKPKYSRSELVRYINDKYINGTKENYISDEFSYKKSSDIDVGNLSIYDIFLKLPFSPAIATSGTDYFYHSILDCYNKSKLYHNRKVLHRYDDSRYDKNRDMSQYHISKAKSRCSKIYYEKLYSKLQIDSDKEEINVEKIYNQMINIANLDLVKEQEKVIDSMINIFKNTNLEKYQNMSNTISVNKNNIINQTSKDMIDHAFLIKYWNDIIFSAKNNSFDKWYFNHIE